LVQRVLALRAERSGLSGRDDRPRALALAVRSAPKWWAATAQIQAPGAALELHLVAAAQVTAAAALAVRRPVPGLIADRPPKRRPTQNRQAESPYMFSNASLPPNAHNIMHLRERPRCPRTVATTNERLPHSLSRFGN
jgi:hypothetical protein